MALSFSEQETVIRWSREKDEGVVLWTAAPHEARRWRRAGYAVEQDGVGWKAVGPAGCVRVRKVKDGALVKRVGRVPNDLKVRVPF